MSPRPSTPIRPRRCGSAYSTHSEVKKKVNHRVTESTEKDTEGLTPSRKDAKKTTKDRGRKMAWTGPLSFSFSSWSVLATLRLGVRPFSLCVGLLSVLSVTLWLALL